MSEREGGKRHGTEAVYWIAASGGLESDGIEIERLELGDTPAALPDIRPFATSAGVQTLRERDPAVPRIRLGHDERFELRLQEEQHKDDETMHVAETVGIVCVRC